MRILNKYSSYFFFNAMYVTTDDIFLCGHVTLTFCKTNVVKIFFFKGVVLEYVKTRDVDI